MAEEKKKAAPVKNTNAVKKEEKKLGFFQRIGKWFRELKSELKKVVWPDGKTTAKNTGTVILCSLGVGVFIWVFDAVAVLAVKTLVSLFAA
jgi:preprotein translocase subunit SecE